MKINFLSKVRSRYYWMGGILLCTVILFTSISSRKSGIIQDVRISIKPLQGGELLVQDKDIINTITSNYGSTLDGLAIREIDVQKIEDFAKMNPFVKKAEVFIDARSRLCVNITQNNPLLRIFDKYGHSYYIDEDLKTFPVSRHDSPRMLIASGYLPAQNQVLSNADSMLIHDVVKIADEISKDEFAQRNSEQIYVEEDGNIVLATKLGNQKFIIGDASRIEEKLNYIQIYYKNIASTAGWRKYKFVNLKFDGQIVCN